LSIGTDKCDVMNTLCLNFPHKVEILQPF
jgi:hypothetical protein